MSPAVITLDFDPVVTFEGWAVRWQVLGLAGAVLMALLLAAWIAGRAGRSAGLPRLRRDDLLFLAVAAVPGAVIGGRLFHVVAYLDYYATHPERIVDPAQGGLSLLGAVLGGMVSAAYMASLMGLPVRRWLDVAAIAVLVGIGLGKLSLVLGGEGQGQAFAGTWALAFAGDGPWYSPAPGMPAHPAQVYEALWNLAGAFVLAFLAVGPVTRRLPGAIRQTGAYAARREARGAPVAPGMLRFGVLFFVGLAWFVVGRIVVGFAWKDDPIAGGMNAEQLVAAGVIALMALYLVAFIIVRRLRDR